MDLVKSFFVQFDMRTDVVLVIRVRKMSVTVRACVRINLVD